MSLWQKLLVTLVAMLVVSYLAGVVCLNVFGVTLPSYVGGMVGGLTAIPVWELMKRIGPRRPDSNLPR